MNAIEPTPVPDGSVRRAIEHYSAALAAIHELRMEMYEWRGKEICFRIGQEVHHGRVLNIVNEPVPRRLLVVNTSTGTEHAVHMGQIIAHYQPDSLIR